MDGEVLLGRAPIDDLGRIALGGGLALSDRVPGVGGGQSGLVGGMLRLEVVDEEKGRANRPHPAHGGQDRPDEAGQGYGGLHLRSAGNDGFGGVDDRVHGGLQTSKRPPGLRAAARG
jgi:hypothetical protein